SALFRRNLGGRNGKTQFRSSKPFRRSDRAVNDPSVEGAAVGARGQQAAPLLLRPRPSNANPAAPRPGIPGAPRLAVGPIDGPFTARLAWQPRRQPNLNGIVVIFRTRVPLPVQSESGRARPLSG